MSQTPLKRDPFGPVATPTAYVPRAATEEAFARLESAVLDDGRVAVLHGPAGLGKTMLLRRLAEAGRERFSPVYLPYASLTPDELCSWTLESLGATASDDPPKVFRAWLGHLVRQGAPLLLLVDDATALPGETAAWLVQLAKEGVLRLVLAGLEGEGTAAFREKLPEDAERIRLAEPMSEEETRDYLCARLEMAEVPESQRAAFDHDVVENLFEVSHGNPRRLHQAASAVLRGARPDAIVAFMDGHGPVAEEPAEATPLPDGVLEPLYAEEAPEAAEASEPVEAAEQAPAEPAPEPIELPGPAPSEPVEPAAEPETNPLPEADDPVEAIEPDAPVEAEADAGPEPPEVHGEIVLARHAPGRPGSGSLLLRRSGPRAELAAPPAPPIPEAAQVLADALGEDDPGLLEDLGLDAQLPPPPASEELPEPARIAAEAREVPEPARQPADAELENTLQEAGQTLVEATGLLREATLALGAPGTPRGEARAALREAVGALRDAIAAADTAVGHVAGPGRLVDDSQTNVLLGALARVGTVVGVSALLGAGAVFLFQSSEAPPPPAPAPIVETRPAPAPAVVETPAPAPAPAPVKQAAPAVETFPIGVNARPWAHVEVDGRDVGMTPIAALELEAGLHIFRARMPDGRIVVRRVEIGPDVEPLVFQ